MMLYWGRGGDTWEPQGGRRVKWIDLSRGDLIVIRRQMWRVHEVRLVPVVDWDELDEETYARYSFKYPVQETREAFHHRPVYLIAEPAKGGKKSHMKARPAGTWIHGGVWVVPEHYPVCSSCGELYPCQHLEIEATAEKEMAGLAKLVSILPGCCWNCAKPITERQKSIVFDGENLLLPGGPPVAFHMRKGSPYCGSAAIDYEERWVEAGPDRHPRLFCPGRVVVHVDGPECSEDPYCPGPRMNHQSYWNHRADSEGLAGCLRCKDAAARGESAAADPADDTEHLW